MVFVKRRVDATRHSRSGCRQFEEPELNLRSIIVLGLLGWLFVGVGCATPSLENRHSATLDSNREAIEAAGPRVDERATASPVASMGPGTTPPGVRRERVFESDPVTEAAPPIGRAGRTERLRAAAEEARDAVD